MEEEKLFRIGDVAKMFHISTGTLRHYERMGIVVPEYIEEKSGYRYYSIRQFEVLNAIRRLEKDQPDSLTFLGKVGVGISKEKLENRQLEAYDRVFLVLDDEENYQDEVEQLPETRSVSIRFCGGHQEAEKYYQKLLIYIEEHHLKIAGFSREITLIDYGITNDTGKFVTEILIPVATI